MKDDIYYFHQTPVELAKGLIQKVPLEKDDIVLEPFRGEGAFYNNFPDFVHKEWCEIVDGKDFRSYDGAIDWVVSNPPFKLEDNGTKENAFYTILKHYAPHVRKGIAFLGNDYCFSTLTPKRIKELQALGLYIRKIVVCSVKKWRGRYFFIVFEKKKTDFYDYIEGSY